MLVKDYNKLNNYIYLKEEKYLLNNKRQNSKLNQKNLIDKSSNNESIRNILLESYLFNNYYISK